MYILGAHPSGSDKPRALPTYMFQTLDTVTLPVNVLIGVALLIVTVLGFACRRTRDRRPFLQLTIREPHHTLPATLAGIAGGGGDKDFLLEHPLSSVKQLH